MSSIRKPLRFVAPFRCLNDFPFEPGEVRRVLDLPLKLIGYHVCCPNCATRQVLLATDVTFVEEGQVRETDSHSETQRTFLRPAKVTTPVRGASCLRCRKEIRFEGDMIVVE